MYHRLSLKMSRLPSPLLNGERGVFLIDALVATAIMGTAFVTVLMGLSTGSIVTGLVDVDVTASNIARNQLESVYNQDYVPAPTTYLSVLVPSTYSVTADAVTVDGADSNIEKIIVTVSKDGVMELVVETFKTNR